MYAIIKDGGKEYQVSVNDVVTLEKKEAAPGTLIEFPQVLFYRKAEQTLIGQPLLENVKVRGVVQKVTKGKKVQIFKFRRRKDSRVKKGHRQQYTQVRIKEIVVE